MENSKNGSVVVGAIRTRLLYKSRDAMAANWEQVFPDDILPDDHVPVPFSKVLPFLKELSVSKRGRSRSITGAAQAFLEELSKKPAPALEAPQVLPEEEKPQNVEPEPETQPFAPLEKGQDVTKVEENREPGLLQLLANFIYGILRGAVMFLVTAGPLDLVFLVGIALADYALWFFMHGIGLAWATVYTLITLHALGMAKDRYSRETAKRGIWAVFLLETVSFLLDYALFNLQVWQAGKREELPFDVWEHPTWPSLIALALAMLFCAAVVYAISTTLALRTERTEAENWEAKSDGLKW